MPVLTHWSIRPLHESLSCPWSLHRMMQDLENPQVTSCNKGDQHYRSSPSNQSSSSDPGPCGSSGWSQQPGYDGYGTTAALLFFFSFLFFFFFFVSSATRNIRFQSNECSSNQCPSFCRHLAILPNDRNFFPIWNDQNHQCTFFFFFFAPVATFFSSRKCCDKGIKFCPSRSHSTCRAQKQEQFKEDNEMFHLFFKCSLFFCRIRWIKSVGRPQSDDKAPQSEAQT